MQMQNAGLREIQDNPWGRGFFGNTTVIPHPICLSEHLQVIVFFFSWEALQCSVSRKLPALT